MEKAICKFSPDKFRSRHEMTTPQVSPYSSKRSRTRTPSASATSCKRRTVISFRPFTIALTHWRLTPPNRRPNSASLTFFSSSRAAGSTATHTAFVSSFLKKSLICYFTFYFVYLFSPIEIPSSADCCKRLSALTFLRFEVFNFLLPSVRLAPSVIFGLCQSLVK